jgi:hypothetical protein
MPTRASVTIGLLLCLLVSAALAEPYGDDWYRMNRWSGEYPNGFTIAQDMRIDIRSKLDLGAPKDVSCQLRKGATYHPWNKTRVRADGLQFVSFTKIEHYELKDDSAVNLIRQSDEKEVVVKFKKGDRWAYLAGLAEGMFVMRFAGVTYFGYQDLFERSSDVAAGENGNQSQYDEWLKLKCANGAVGWILASDVEDAPGFTRPDIVDYGRATDEPPQQGKKQ